MSCSCVIGGARGASRGTYHELRAQDPVREARVVLDVRRRRQLTAGGDAVGHEAFVEDGYQLSAAMRLG